MSGSQPGADGFMQVNARDYQAQREMLTLFDQIWNAPDVGAQVRRKAKELRPQIQIPDEHPIVTEARAQRAEIETKLTGLETAFNDYRTAAETKSAETRLRTQLGEVQDRFKFTDEAMANVVKTMQDRQLADPEAAALLYRESLPKSPPSSANNRLFSDNKADMFGTTKQDEAWEKLHTDPDAFFTDTVNQVFSEMPVSG